MTSQERADLMLAEWQAQRRRNNVVQIRPEPLPPIRDERRFSSPLNGLNIALGFFGWLAIAVLAFEIFRP